MLQRQFVFRLFGSSSDAIFFLPRFNGSSVFPSTTVSTWCNHHIVVGDFREKAGKSCGEKEIIFIYAMSSANSILFLFHTKGLSLTLSLLTFDYLENLRCSHHLNPCLIKAPAYSLIRSDLWRSKKGRREGENVFCGKTSLLAFLPIKYARGLRAKNQ